MKLLHIDSSILGDASASRQLGAELVQGSCRDKGKIHSFGM
ncbi:FMN-dependent NADH-azoreductase 1 [Pseudomonas paraeruginosa]|nr:FMN-dependent NADH-azoreductase 1 [Pseudomonas aeruginosa]